VILLTCSLEEAYLFTPSMLRSAAMELRGTSNIPSRAAGRISGKPKKLIFTRFILNSYKPTNITIKKAPPKEGPM
jgi:hypothetical protein